MRLDISTNNEYLFMKDDPEGNVENIEDKNDKIRYGCESKYIYISIFLLMTKFFG